MFLEISSGSGFAPVFGVEPGAGDGIRTRDINLGKVALYQLSYSRAGKHCYCRAVAGSLSKYQGPRQTTPQAGPVSRNALYDCRASIGGRFEARQS